MRCCPCLEILNHFSTRAHVALPSCIGRASEARELTRFQAQGSADGQTDEHLPSGGFSHSKRVKFSPQITIVIRAHSTRLCENLEEGKDGPGVCTLIGRGGNQAQRLGISRQRQQQVQRACGRGAVGHLRKKS